MTWAPSETQKKIYELLVSDANLTGLVSGIYDHVPQEDVDYPFVVIGMDEWTERSSHTTLGWTGALQVHVWYRGKGRRGLHEIMGQIDSTLHCSDLSANGWQGLDVRHNRSTTFTEDDGVTLHGIIEYNYLTVRT